MILIIQHDRLFPQFQYTILRTTSYQLLGATDNCQVCDDITMCLGWVF